MRIERIDLELVVVQVVTIGIDEHLEIVVVVDDRVTLGECASYMGLLHVGGDVEIVLVPSHLGPGKEAGRGLASPSMSPNSMVQGASTQAGSPSLPSMTGGLFICPAT